MKLSITQKILLPVAGVIIILVITNPSASAFKDYLGKDNYKGLRRKVNFLIGSEYQDSSFYDHEHHNNTYYAVVGNFFYIKPKPENVTTEDSAKMADTADMKKDPFAEFGGREIKK